MSFRLRAANPEDSELLFVLHQEAMQDVVSGLRALAARDRAVASWLRDQVAPAYDRLQADPDSGRGRTACAS